MAEKREIGNPPRFLLPGVEFEGPMGFFWSMEEVPFEALIHKEINEGGND